VIDLLNKETLQDGDNAVTKTEAVTGKKGDSLGAEKGNEKKSHVTRNTENTENTQAPMHTQKKELKTTQHKLEKKTVTSSYHKRA
jgi:hypothetical protein